MFGQLNPQKLTNGFCAKWRKLKGLIKLEKEEKSIEKALKITKK